MVLACSLALLFIIIILLAVFLCVVEKKSPGTLRWAF